MVKAEAEANASEAKRLGSNHTSSGGNLVCDLIILVL